MTKEIKIVFLVGMPGVGKTFLGKYAAQKLGVDFIDLDSEIIRHYNLSIAEIFSNKGESEFRLIEIKELKKIIKQCNTNTIIATGGGTPCYNNAIKLMNRFGISVWLDACVEDLFANIIKDNPDRPLFNKIKQDEMKSKINEMLAQRTKFYRQSKVKVSVYKGLSPDLFTKSLHLSTFAI